MPKKGLTFGDTRLYGLHKYYRGWIERTIMSAHNMILNSHDKLRILQLKDCIDPIKIEDPGRLPYSQFQKSGKNCLKKTKVACLLVTIRNLIQKWWKCEKEHPEGVEPLLVELDQIIEMWKREKVVGDVRIGFHLEEVME